MQIKSILAGAAIALAATMGSASAGEMLTLSAIPAEPLTAAEKKPSIWLKGGAHDQQ